MSDTEHGHIASELFNPTPYHAQLKDERDRYKARLQSIIKDESDKRDVYIQKIKRYPPLKKIRDDIEYMKQRLTEKNKQVREAKKSSREAMREAEKSWRKAIRKAEKSKREAEYEMKRARIKAEESVRKADKSRESVAHDLSALNKKLSHINALAKDISASQHVEQKSKQLVKRADRLDNRIAKL